MTALVTVLGTTDVLCEVTGCGYAAGYRDVNLSIKRDGQTVLVLQMLHVSPAMATQIEAAFKRTLPAHPEWHAPIGDDAIN